ncbi:MAG: molecular chaperone TorD family protein [Firmicutes bacterium]|uniref:TorD/DmsD family molecular chaperone n=2 Tax=Limnochorda TaxID=1676651 RepID=UPI0017BDD1CE|nr:molecular chaperone TorD family protein [Limnochorda pilosa]MBO2486271.1 molecular chaperone TorD [Bacillota bacterium]MBO2518407.1 molecular chaperone TorD [Bacillota bacterium]NMA72117.1 molecular chaperone TorD family protein [Bacillota bacterium]
MDQEKHTAAVTETTTKEFLLGEILTLSLLGRTFYAFPEPAWIDGLVKNDVFQDVPLAADHADVRQGMALARQWLDGRSSQQAADILESDYIRLFVGGGRHILAPPWESVYVSSEPLLLQRETLEVRNWYARYGLVAEKKGQEPDDHVGLELEFVAHLAGLALEALERGEQTRFQEAMDAQRAFLKEHVLRWVPTWATHVAQHAQTDFYRGCALMTRGLFQVLAEALGVA